MANFEVFKPILYAQEGYYANVKNDSGGETWMGIARKKFPSWKGWQVIDSVKPAGAFVNAKQANSILKPLTQLQTLVDTFYKVNFWDAMQGDKINNQSIANYIGDWGVNAGLGVPVKHTQKLLGLTQDGVIGPKTLAAINATDGQTLFNNLVKERIEFYKAVIAAHPEDEEFRSNWMQRANAFKYSAQ